MHHVPAELFHVHLARGGDQVIFLIPAQRVGNRFRFGFRLFAAQQIDFIKDQPARFGGQLFAVLLKLAHDDTGVFRRIGAVDRIEIDQVQQHAATLKMLQETNAKARAFRRAFDKTRNIGHHEAFLIIHAHHTKARHQRGKRIIRDFRLRCGDRTNERGFTSVWHTQHTDIRQQHQLQLQIAFLARRAHGFLARRTVNGGFETGVAKTVPAALRDHQTLAVFGHVAHRFARTLIDNARPDRHFDGHVFTAFTGAVAALAVLTAFGAERFLKAVIDKGVKVFVGLKPDVAAIAAIAAVRAAFRDIFFTTEAYAAVTAITRHDQDRSFINKLHFTSP